MENLFLRVFTVSAAVSLLLLPLLLCRGWMEKRYSPWTRWGLWFAIALVLLAAPWVPKPQAPVVVEAPTVTLTLPTRPQVVPSVPNLQPVTPAEAVGEPNQLTTPINDQTQNITPVQPETHPQIPTQTNAQPVTPTAPQPTAPQRSTITLTALLGVIWLAGLTLVLLRQSVWYLLARRRLLRASKPVTGLEHYAAELDLEGRVTFYHCKAVPGPMTLGVWHPAVLLPSEGLAVAALRHELYHVKRRDVAYKVFLLCACALHWYNPLVWLMYRLADRDVEACCDAAVVEGRDSGYKRSYGELLLTTAAEPQALPFTTSFGGEAEQMKSRLTQLFRPGKQSRALVCLVLALSIALGTLVACRQTAPKVLADGVYCSPYANVTWPIGEQDAEGEDYGFIGLSLLDYSDTEGPNGKPLGEFILPLSEDLMLRQTWWGEDRSAGEKGTQEWQQAVFSLVHLPMYRDSIFLGVEYLVVTVKNGEVTRLSWAYVDREDELPPDDMARLTPLTENTMPTLVYYDPDRDFLLYHTLDTVCFHYGDHHEEFRADQFRGRRVIWRCDVSEDESMVYLSDVFDDSENRDEHFYAWDIDAKTLTEMDAIPPGVDNMTHPSPDELFYSGFQNGTKLRSNVIKAHDGTLVGLYIDELLGNTMEYLQLERLRDGHWEGGAPFLTPEKISAPRDYIEPDWGFVLRLPESMEGNYVVTRAANNWNFYAKDLYPRGMGYLFSLWAEDFDTQQATVDSQGGLWSGKIPGEKDGITYVLTTWDEEYCLPAELENKTYMTMLRDSWNITADDLDLAGVTRSSGYLWPLPYTEYGSDRLLSEENNTLRILSPEGVTVQAAAGGKVVSLQTDPATGTQTLILSHRDGWYTEYGHLEYVQVSEGDDLRRGDILAFPKLEGDRRWLTYRLLTSGNSADAAMDPWSVMYRTYDFLPVTRDRLTIAGDPFIEETLQAVLRGELDFYDTEFGSYRNINYLGDSDGVSVSVYCYAQLDMDNDAVPEVVLWLQRGEDPYQLGSIILRYQGGIVYGYPMGFRSMNLLDLKRDGTYNWSGGAFHNGWGRKDFYRDETVNTLWHEDDRYYENGASITQEAYAQAQANQEAKPDVVWYRWGGGAYLTIHLADGRFLEVRLLTTEPDQSYFPVHRIEVYEGGSTLLQTIDTVTLPQPEDYAWDGCFVNRGYTVGEPIVKDLNFDGSQDFGLLAVSGYPHNVPYNYFLWNQEKNCFEYAFTRFSELEPDPVRRELVETEYSTTGDIQNRYKVSS